MNVLVVEDDTTLRETLALNLRSEGYQVTELVTFDPGGPSSKPTTLPMQISWTSRPQAEFRNIAAAAVLVMLAMLLTLNASAVLLRNRCTRQF